MFSSVGPISLCCAPAGRRWHLLRRRVEPYCVSTSYKRGSGLLQLVNGPWDPFRVALVLYAYVLSSCQGTKIMRIPIMVVFHALLPFYKPLGDLVSIRHLIFCSVGEISFELPLIQQFSWR